MGRGRDGVGVQRRAGRRRGEERRDGGEGSCGGQSRDDVVCPLRHKNTELCDVCQNR